MKYLIYLIFGTSISMVSCKEDPIEAPLKQAVFNYVNQTDSIVKMIHYNKFGSGSSVQYTILKDESKSIQLSDGIRIPFAAGSQDSVRIISGSKCATYKIESPSEGVEKAYYGEGVFDFNNYENFDESIFNQKKIELFYLIKDSQLNSQNCP